jgi:hypothetical protein
MGGRCRSRRGARSGSRIQPPRLRLLARVAADELRVRRVVVLVVVHGAFAARPIRRNALSDTTASYGCAPVTRSG